MQTGNNARAAIAGPASPFAKTEIPSSKPNQGRVLRVFSSERSIQGQQYKQCRPDRRRQGQIKNTDLTISGPTRRRGQDQRGVSGDGRAEPRAHLTVEERQKQDADEGYREAGRAVVSQTQGAGCRSQPVKQRGLFEPGFPVQPGGYPVPGFPHLASNRGVARLVGAHQAAVSHPLEEQQEGSRSQQNADADFRRGHSRIFLV